MDLDVSRVRELLDQREAIDTELAGIFGGKAAAARKAKTCGKCGKEGHNAATCPERTPAAPPQE